MGHERRGRLGWEWVPALVVGAAAASAGELAAGLLLYSSEGFLRALTLVLATELGALGLGLWVAPAVVDPVESVRRRWLFVLVAFTAAAAFSGAWALLEGFAAAPLSQGLGLAVLAGLPLYGVGALLAVLAGEERHHGRPASGRFLRASPAMPPGAPAVLGAAGGVFLTGVILVPRLQAPSVLLLWLVALSGAALLHGWILDGRTVVRSLETLPSSYGPVEVELWQRGSDRAEVRVVTENGRVRGGEDGGGRPVLAWEKGAAILAQGRATGRDSGDPGGFLLLGGGTGTLARLLGGIAPGARLVLVERNPEVTRAARRHLSEEGDPEMDRIHDDPLERLGGIAGPFDAVFLDGAGVMPGDPVPLVSVETLRALRTRLAAGGALVVAPLPADEGGGFRPVEALLARAREVFPEAIHYRGARGGGLGVAGEDGGLLLLPRDGGGEWPDRLGALEAAGAVPGFVATAPETREREDKT